MKRKSLVSSAALLGGILALAPAATAAPWSGWGVYGPVNGYEYANRSGFSDSNGYPEVAARSNDSSTLIPISYAGVQIAVFTESGAECDRSGWYYNSVATVTQAQSWGPGNCGGSGTNLYVRGDTRAYNGNGYDAFVTFSSPVSTLP